MAVRVKERKVMGMTAVEKIRSVFSGSLSLFRIRQMN